MANQAADTCIVCRNYEDIDKFATANNLDTMWQEPTFQAILLDMKETNTQRGILREEAKKQEQQKIDEKEAKKPATRVNDRMDELMQKIAEAEEDWEVKTDLVEARRKLRLANEAAAKQPSAQASASVEAATKLIASLEPLNKAKEKLKTAKLALDSLPLPSGTNNNNNNNNGGSNNSGVSTDQTAAQAAVIKVQKAEDKVQKAAKAISSAVEQAYLKLKELQIQLDNVSAEVLAAQGSGMNLAGHEIATLALRNQENVRKLAIALHDKCVDADLITPTDYVGRARLFYTWISLSIEFNLATDSVSNLETRSNAETILSKKEVCIGYANLFATMFNAIPRNNGEPEGFVASQIIGWSKSNAQRCAPKVSLADSPQGNAQHAWNAFPTKIESGAITWKLIDACWAQAAIPGVVGVVSRPRWFTLSHQSFLIRHYPLPAAGRGQPDIKMAEFYLPDKDRITLNAFWDRNLPRFFESCRYTDYIDQLSLTPASYDITGPLFGKKAFEFKQSCPHQVKKFKASIPGFYLLVGTRQPQTDDEWKRVAEFTLSEATGTWTAAADLSGFAANGTYFVTLAVAGFRDRDNGDRFGHIAPGAVELLKDQRDLIQWEYLAEWQIGTPPSQSSSSVKASWLGGLVNLTKSIGK